MTTAPTPPAAGTHVSSSFFARLIAWVKSIMLVEGTGYRLSRGPNGTRIILNPQVKHSPSKSYWRFTYPDDVESDEDDPRNPCWSNCRLQIGYDASFSEVECSGGLKIYQDGVYYAEVDLENETWELKRVNGDNKAVIPPNDCEKSKVNLFVGIVTNKTQVYSIDCIPVAYKYV